jgi:protoporphyrinogen oxidase
MVPSAPEHVREAASRLRYRDFITVALIIKKEFIFADNWIYLHDPGITAGRIQNFKNWSPDMVPDRTRTCLGMEYFCFENDELWNSPDEKLAELAKKDLIALGFARPEEIEDFAVIRVRKAYPVYTLDYKRDLAVLREYLRKFENLQLMGRNGLHRYNNQDHSMITGILAARNASGAAYDVFKVNEDAQYLEVQEDRA